MFVRFPQKITFANLNKDCRLKKIHNSSSVSTVRQIFIFSPSSLLRILWNFHREELLSHGNVSFIFSRMHFSTIHTLGLFFLFCFSKLPAFVQLLFLYIKTESVPIDSYVKMSTFIALKGIFYTLL